MRHVRPVIFVAMSFLASLLLLACNKAANPPQPLRHAISGHVTGSVSAAVTVTLGGAETATAVTDPSGAYAFPGLTDGAYTVTPALNGYVFAPESRSVTVGGADVTGQDFTSTSARHSISGQVSGAVTVAVTITLSGAKTAMTTTDASGTYTFADLADGDYTMTPSLGGYVFNPEARGATVGGADVTGQDFVCSIPHTISGTVSGAVVADIDLFLDTGYPRIKTDAKGNYLFTGVAQGWHTVKASLPGYVVAPASRLVQVADTDLTSIDFVTTPGGIFHWDGTAWSFVAGADRLVGISGSSRTDAWAVGGNGVIWHWDGSAWAKSSSGTIANLHGTAATGPTNAWAVGDGGLILHWNGKAWSPVTSGTSATLHAAWASAVDDAWAVGDSGTILHWNGSAWTIVPSGSLTNLERLWGRASNDVSATGDTGTDGSQAMMLHWDGQAWSPSTIPGATWISASNDAWGGRCGIGSNSNGFYAFQTISHWTPGTWTDLVTLTWAPSGPPCGSGQPWFWGLTPGDMWVGYPRGGKIYHWNGVALVDQSSNLSVVQGLWGPTSNDVWAVVTSFP
ncbi:MAG TPA: carboxypeptidase-like regulatory domain-containing protein [Geothrix sp.]|nr:carboxypeptidase-like regulatory domain-containing protein [Geothrix sp.]